MRYLPSIYFLIFFDSLIFSKSLFDGQPGSPEARAGAGGEPEDAQYGDHAENAALRAPSQYQGEAGSCGDA